jgi:hypothetical protein
MTKIRNYDGTLDELVFSIGNLHYDVTSFVLKKVADNLVKRAYAVNSSRYRDISNYIYEATEHIDVAWNKCKNKMIRECSKHPRQIQDFYGTIDDLTQDVSNAADMDLVIFLDRLGDDFRRQADADWKRGRKKLATELYNAANCLYKGRMEV